MEQYGSRHATGVEERSMNGNDNREERYRATFEQAAVGLSHLAPDGRWLEVNDRLCRITGYTREEMTSRPTWSRREGYGPERYRPTR